jgi:hypothetical protein
MQSIRWVALKPRLDRQSKIESYPSHDLASAPQCFRLVPNANCAGVTRHTEDQLVADITVTMPGRDLVFPRAQVVPTPDQLAGVPSVIGCSKLEEDRTVVCDPRCQHERYSKIAVAIGLVRAGAVHRVGDRQRRPCIVARRPRWKCRWAWCRSQCRGDLTKLRSIGVNLGCDDRLVYLDGGDGLGILADRDGLRGVAHLKVSNRGRIGNISFLEIADRRTLRFYRLFECCQSLANKPVLLHDLLDLALPCVVGGLEFFAKFGILLIDLLDQISRAFSLALVQSLNSTVLLHVDRSLSRDLVVHTSVELQRRGEHYPCQDGDDDQNGQRAGQPRSRDLGLAGLPILRYSEPLIGLH